MTWLSSLAAQQPPAGPEVAFLGLGSNVGDRLHYLNRAVRLLHGDSKISVDDISAVYETEAVSDDPNPQATYYNIAVRILTLYSPVKLLGVTQHLERQLGRVRTARWAPRTIDIDVLLYGARRVEHPRLEIPHPRLTERGFALVPLIEVAPGWKLADGRSLGAIVANLAPLDAINAIGRQVSLEPLPSGPPPRTGSVRTVAGPAQTVTAPGTT